MRLSLCLDPSRPWRDARALAQRVDAAGWYAVYQCDHFMPYDPEGLARDGAVSECWTTLSALATQTEQVRLGSLVLGNTYRHPALVASMAATLDQVSGGRVVLGLGAGWQVNEHTAYGIELPPVPGRIDALDDACRVIRSLLDERRSTVVTARYAVRDAPCDPKPVQDRLPLLVGGGGERRTMRVAAQYADVWHAWADPGTLRHKCSVLDRHCDDVGRDPRSIARSTGGTVALRAHGAAGSPVEVDDVHGTAEQVLETLLEYRDSGADEFIVRDDASALSVDATTDLIESLSRDVLPHLAS